MSKKLLNESTVRRFMGLANLAPLSESFLDNQVDEEDEITENEEVVEEGGAAARVGNEGHDVGKGRMTADRIHEDEEEVKAEGLIGIQEDELEDEEEAAAEMGGEVAMDAEVDMGAEEPEAELGAEEPEAELGAEEGGEDLAAKAQSILTDLADLLTQAGIETTVTSDEEEVAADDDMAAADDMADAGTNMMDAEDDMEDAEEDLMQETNAEANINNEDKKSSVDALVAEITSKVINRLNK